MIRYLTVLACCLFTALVFSNEEEEPREGLFLSTPEQVATLTSEPSYLIGGLISPLSGQPALRQTDLIVKGAQNIVLSRTYLPPYVPCSFPCHKHYQEDAAKSGTTGHKAQDHWHRYNPDSSGDVDKYLDAKGNPVPDGHPDSHLYPR